MFGQALRGYLELLQKGDEGAAEAVLAWLSGQPNVAAAAKRQAGVKGEIDHDGALTFLRGLLVVLRDSGHAGLILVLTGTPAFFDGPQGVRRLEPLAQRLHTDFDTNPKFDNPRAPQIRLTGFDQERLLELGLRVRDLFAEGSEFEDRVRAKVDDAFVSDFARALVGELGGKVGIAPRIFLRKLVSNVLDKVELFEAFNPRVDAGVTVDPEEMRREEAAAAGNRGVEAVELDMDGDDD